MKIVHETREQSNDLADMAANLDIVAKDCKAKGDNETATSMLMQEADLLGQLGDLQGKAQAIMLAGSWRYQNGDYIAAIDAYNQVLDINISTGNFAGIATSYQNLGTAYRNAEQFTKAHESFRKSMALNDEIGNLANVALTLGSDSKAWDMEGNGDEAIDAKQEMADVYLGLDAKKEAADALSEMADLQTKYDKQDAANASLEQAAVLYEEINMLDQASQCRAKKIE